MVDIERARRPFWMHQIVEYMIGLVLIAAAVQQPKPAVPAVMGLLIILNAAITIGPAGAFSIIGRKLHRVLDVILMLVLAASTLQPWVEEDLTGRLVVGAITFIYFIVWFHTDFEGRAERKSRRAARAKPESEELGKKAGRMVGDSVNSLKRWKDSITDADGEDE
ncbi:MAG: hypothetical protein DRJ50_03545 [Actinobacteria bacterium]|nr:MAG: hypothetical protein DRJ50_03545 [Actinomycetota bacterium]